MDKRPFAVLGLFDDPQCLMDAIAFLKGKVSGRLEAYTPYPIHGIDKALGLKKSPVAGMVFVMGVIGALAGIGLELWTSAIDYPLMTAGKPFWSWQAFVPIMFEVTVLFATFTAGLGALLLLNRLPYFRHPMLRARSMPLITRDKFALAVEFEGKELDIDGITALLNKTGARSTEVVEAPLLTAPMSADFLLRGLSAIALACLVAGYLTYWGSKLFPVSVPMVHMLDQPRVDAQRESRYFADGFGMRLPVPGTVARGYLPYSIKTQDEAAVLVNPLPMTAAVLARGRQVFDTYCAVCHGPVGNGVSALTAAYGAKPANLTAQTIRDYPDGKIFHVVTAGKNAMPNYAAELDAGDRWSAVHYVRALQRALNARDSDLPKEVRK